MKLLVNLLMAVFFLTACGKNTDYVYHDNPPPIRISKKSYPVVELNDNKVDVLWVVDNSGSMMDIQQDIVTNADLFMSKFIQEKYLNWKMGLMSTDKGEDPYLGFSTEFSRDFPTPNPVTTFGSAVNRLGTNGSASEYLFYNVHRAMFNANLNTFFRPKAHLAVILVTDEEEQSEDDFGSQYSALSLLSYLRANMATDSILRFYGAFNYKDLQDCSQWQPEYAGSPLETIITATGGMVKSACDPSFGIGLAAIGKDIVNFSQSPFITLNERPVTSTLVVSYKGKVFQGGPEHEGGHWYYNEYFNKIFFYNLDFIPSGDPADMEVTFDIYDGIPRG